MAIKNKDGSIFRLNKPNPAMNQQDLWDDGSQYILHNFTQEEFILHNFDKQEKEYQPIDEIEVEEIKVQIKETVIPKKDSPKNIITLYCMPAITNNANDPLYNEKKVSIVYGPQYTFEAIITISSDLVWQIWSVKDSPKNSIIFHPETKRWWKVENSFKEDNGYYMGCKPSTIQPSFRVEP